MFEIWPPGGATCISPNFDRNVAQLKKFYKGVGGCLLGMATRMREFAVHADQAHIREYADADENLIHIIRI